jgi:phosphatidylinositol kinase/protein kinase (PI-3  family)
MSNDDSDIIFQLYKLSSVILPEKNTRSLDEIYKHLYPQSKLQKPDLLSRLKMTLRKLEEKQAVIFVDDFNSISLVEPKLSELVDVSKSDQI